MMKYLTLVSFLLVDPSFSIYENLINASSVKASYVEAQCCGNNCDLLATNLFSSIENFTSKLHTPITNFKMGYIEASIPLYQDCMSTCETIADELNITFYSSFISKHVNMTFLNSTYVKMDLSTGDSDYNLRLFSDYPRQDGFEIDLDAIASESSFAQYTTPYQFDPSLDVTTILYVQGEGPDGTLSDQEAVIGVLKDMSAEIVTLSYEYEGVNYYFNKTKSVSITTEIVHSFASGISKENKLGGVFFSAFNEEGKVGDTNKTSMFIRGKNCEHISYTGTTIVYMEEMNVIHYSHHPNTKIISNFTLTENSSHEERNFLQGWYNRNGAISVVDDLSSVVFSLQEQFTNASLSRGFVFGGRQHGGEFRTKSHTSKRCVFHLDAKEVKKKSKTKSIKFMNWHTEETMHLIYRSHISSDTSVWEVYGSTVFLRTIDDAKKYNFIQCKINLAAQSGVSSDLQKGKSNTSCNSAEDAARTLIKYNNNIRQYQPAFSSAFCGDYILKYKSDYFCVKKDYFCHGGSTLKDGNQSYGYPNKDEGKGATSGPIEFVHLFEKGLTLYRIEDINHNIEKTSKGVKTSAGLISPPVLIDASSLNLSSLASEMREEVLTFDPSNSAIDAKLILSPVWTEGIVSTNYGFFQKNTTNWLIG